jgi:hypothetical protein
VTDKDQKLVDRASKAAALLSNELFNEGFSLVRGALLERLENWSLEDPRGAEQLRMMLKLLRDVRANFEQAVRDGKVASVRLEEERRQLSPAEWSGHPRTGTYGP